MTNENYGFKGKGCIGLLIKNEIPVNEVNILSKDVIIDGETYTLSSNINYDINYITEKSTNISVDEDGIIITDTSFNRRFQSKSSLSIHGIEVPCKLFSDFGNMSSKTVLKTPFPISFRLDIGQNNDLNLNSARDQIIYDDTWLTFEEDFYKVVCSQLKSIVGDSDWQKFKSLIKENVTEVFYRIAENI